jgi:hypothetical protein
VIYYTPIISECCEKKLELLLDWRGWWLFQAATHYTNLLLNAVICNDWWADTVIRIHR